jgi:hypothetical protein
MPDHVILDTHFDMLKHYPEYFKIHAVSRLLRRVNFIGIYNWRPYESENYLCGEPEILAGCAESLDDHLKSAKG